MRHDARVSDAAPGRHVGRRADEDRDEGVEDAEGGGGAHARASTERAGPTAPTFPHKPLLRTGYDRAAVDAFVAKAVLAVHDERQTSVTAEEVAGTRFPGRRFGSGYRMREVDDYLGVVEALLRMRATGRGAHPDPAPTDVGREPEHRSHATWWVYGTAALVIVVIVVFTMTQT